MQHVGSAGELLLALHIRLGAGQHDPAVHRNASLSGVPVPGFFVSVGIHRPDDHGAQFGGARGAQV